MIAGPPTPETQDRSADNLPVASLQPSCISQHVNCLLSIDKTETIHINPIIIPRKLRHLILDMHTYPWPIAGAILEVLIFGDAVRTEKVELYMLHPPTLCTIPCHDSIQAAVGIG